MDTLVSTQAALKELTSTSQLLHLTHHRNKNQHRLATWYKYLSQLRRHINKLIPELQSLETALTFASKEKNGKENKYVKAAHDKVDERVDFMKEHLWQRCYLAFSAVVADNQYAVLGLMLIATLARVKSILGPFGKVNGEPNDEEIIEESMAEEPERQLVEDDFGEVVKRDENVIPAELDEQEEEVGFRFRKSRKQKAGARASSLEVEVGSTYKQRMKKKRKKADAFDDLFDSLI